MKVCRSGGAFSTAAAEKPRQIEPLPRHDILQQFWDFSDCG